MREAGLQGPNVEPIENGVAFVYGSPSEVSAFVVGDNLSNMELLENVETIDKGRCAADDGKSQFDYIQLYKRMSVQASGESNGIGRAENTGSIFRPRTINP